MDKELVARNLLRHRTRRGVTQEQLAERSGVGVRTIQRIEAATAAPHPSTIALLAAALELPVPALTDDAAEASAPPAPAAVPASVAPTGALVVLHLLPLLGLLLPLANVLAPLLYWLYKREEDRRLDAQGRAVLNFQLTVVLGMALTVALLLTYFPAGIFSLAVILLLAPLLSVLNARRAWRRQPVRYPLAIPVFGTPGAVVGGPVAGS